MKLYEIEKYRTHTSTNNEPFNSSEDKPLFSDELEEILDSILDKCGQISIWYFDKLQGDVPWAYVCFYDEVDIAGHIAASRPEESSIRFSPYCYPTNPDAEDFTPKVGTIMVHDKSDCEEISKNSSLFNNIWNELKHCDKDGNWLLLVDTLPDDLKALTEEENKKLWLMNR